MSKPYEEMTTRELLLEIIELLKSINKPRLGPPPPSLDEYKKFVKPIPRWKKPITTTCNKCGMSWEGNMGYICPDNGCPLQPHIFC